MSPITIELCCGGIDDVHLAARNRLPRIELNSGMAVGGLTPGAALTAAARRVFSGAIISMIRPREGGFCYTEHEYQQMLDDCAWQLDQRVDGIAVGFLTTEGTIDLQRCRKLRSLFPSATLVFHKAFDVTPDLKTSLQQLIDCGFDRILTSGGCATAEQGISMLVTLKNLANEQIEILPGGGVRAANVLRLLKETGCNQFHSAVRELCNDPSTHHNDIFQFGLPNHPSGSFGRASETQLEALLTAIRQYTD